MGGEKDAILAMINKEVDASFSLGANYEAWLKDGTIDGNIVEVLDKTEKFDHCIFTFNNNASDEEVEKFTDIMLKMDYENPEHKKIMDLEGLQEWKEGRTSGYEQITGANQYLGNFIEGFNSGKYSL